MMTMAVQTTASRALWPTDVNKVMFVAVLLCAASSLLPRSSADASAIIAQTCRRTPHESLCVSVLQSSKRGISSVATVQGLAVAALDAAREATVRAKIRAVELGAANGSALIRSLMVQCEAAYSNCLRSEATVAGMVSKGTYKSAADAAGKLRAFPESCEGLFATGGMASPLQQANREVEQKLDVSNDIIRLLR